MQASVEKFHIDSPSNTHTPTTRTPSSNTRPVNQSSLGLGLVVAHAVLVLNLRRQVELNRPQLPDLVLHHDGQVLGEAELHLGGEGGGLAEVGQVAQREGEGDGLLQVDDGLVLLLLGRGVVPAPQAGKETGDRGSAMGGHSHCTTLASTGGLKGEPNGLQTACCPAG